MSEYVDLTPELLAGFLDEAPSYLNALEEGLMAFEAAAQDGVIALRDAADHERMNEVFRAAHSLKGISASMGFKGIRDLTHVMESLFDLFRHGKRQLLADEITQILRAVDQLRSLVDEVPDCGEADPVVHQALAALLEQKPGGGAAAPADAGTNAAGATNGVEPQLLQLFVESTAETLELLGQHLLGLEQRPQDSDAINEVFRCAHNIKGASGAVQATHMQRLTHAMETVLDRVRSGAQAVDAALIGACLGAADELQSALEEMRSGKTNDPVVASPRELFGSWLNETDMAVDEAVASGGPGEGGAAADASTPLDQSTRVTIAFAPGFSEAAIMCCIIHNRLSDLGQVIHSDPPVEQLGNDSVIAQVDYYLVTDSKPSVVERVVRAYPVTRCEVRPPAVAEAAATSATAEQAGAGASAKSATGEPAARAAAADGEGKQAGGEKVGKTLRVDLERLDQLMNLGGELVITKARFVEISRKLSNVFAQNNLRYVVEEVADRLARVRASVSALQDPSRAQDSAAAIAELAENSLHLCDEFEQVRGLVSRVHESRSTMGEFGEAVHGLNRIADGLQKRIMQTRMVAIGPLFQRFRRVIRDICNSTGKKVELVLHGESTELDKRMIDELVDPLTHMIRNSVDHGVELPPDRRAKGKPEIGRVTLDAFHRGRHICIQVRDDGKGLDVPRIKAKIAERELAPAAQIEAMSDFEAIQYIFRPGFSTAQQVTDLSGRGMGMDIVKTKIDELNGTVQLESVPGQGATFTIQLPLTLAIINAMMVRVGKTSYAIPLDAVIEIITIPRSQVRNVQQSPVIVVRDKVVPLTLLEDVLTMKHVDQHTRSAEQESLTVLILGMQNERAGLVVDELIGQDDIVIKDIAANYRNVTGIAGASIMGDGSVSLILDVAAIMSDHARRRVSGSIGLDAAELAGVTA